MYGARITTSDALTQEAPAKSIETSLQAKGARFRTVRGDWRRRE
jgi:hypothetical protein